MKLLYNNQNEIIYARIKDIAWDSWAYYNTRIDGGGQYWILKKNGSDNVHLPLDLFDLIENETNRFLCRDILYVRDKTDEAGDQKYSIEAGKVEAKENWKEYHEDLLRR